MDTDADPLELPDASPHLVHSGTSHRVHSSPTALELLTQDCPCRDTVGLCQHLVHPAYYRHLTMHGHRLLELFTECITEGTHINSYELFDAHLEAPSDAPHCCVMSCARAQSNARFISDPIRFLYSNGRVGWAATIRGDVYMVVMRSGPDIN